MPTCRSHEAPYAERRTGKGAHTMNWPVTRTLGALVLAAALATSSTPTFAASHTSSPALNLTEKRVKTFAGLSQTLRTTALEKLRSMPNAIKAPGQGGTQQSQQD